MSISFGSEGWGEELPQSGGISMFLSQCFMEGRGLVGAGHGACCSMGLWWAYTKEAVTLVSRAVKVIRQRLQLFSGSKLGVRDPSHLLHQHLCGELLETEMRLQCRPCGQLCNEASGSCTPWLGLRGSFACTLTAASPLQVTRQVASSGRTTTCTSCSLSALLHAETPLAPLLFFSQTSSFWHSSFLVPLGSYSL